MKRVTAKRLTTALLLSVFTLHLCQIAFAQCFPDALWHSIPNAAPAASDEFGNSVAICGNLMLVGAWKDDAGATDAGTAYVFNAATGELMATLNNPAPAVEDYFGFSVAVSGNVAVVGAYRDDAGATNAGTAYVFNAATGALVATLSNPSPNGDDRFGISVAVSGNAAVVGAYLDDAGANAAGTAYVFNAATGALIATLNNPAPAAGDRFGISVAVSGNVAVVGAHQDDAGASDAGTAYVFNATTGDLTATLTNPLPTREDYFGSSVAVSGNVAVVGAYLDDAGATDAGTAYAFNATTGVIIATLSNPATTPSDYFGYSVAVSGSVAVVGAYWDDAGATDAGSVYVFNAVSASIPAPEDILPALLGQAEPSPDLEANCDGDLDIADLLRSLIPNPQ